MFSRIPQTRGSSSKSSPGETTGTLPVGDVTSAFPGTALPAAMLPVGDVAPGLALSGENN